MKYEKEAKLRSQNEMGNNNKNAKNIKRVIDIDNYAWKKN